MSAPSYDVVIPSLLRPSLAALLRALDAAQGPPPGRLLLVDDRRDRAAPARLPRLRPELQRRLHVLVSGGRGPAAARNAGWLASDAEWVAFLDDDVVPDPDWPARLAEDLSALAPRVAASQGRIHVPGASRPPTDAERRTLALADARWITADLACRREALEALGGFDERFPRAYREDTDLALRILRSGRELVRGRRRTAHPIPPSGPFASVAAQAGNADDVLLDALHGPGWRAVVGEPPGRFRRHAALVGAGLLAALAAAAGRRGVAGAAGAAWLAGSLELFHARARRGPRTGAELARMAVTSLAIPPAAVWHRARGRARVARMRRRGALALTPRPTPARQAGAAGARAALRLVLFDRDGTLILDRPALRDPSGVRPAPRARRALDRLRARGIRAAVVTNQPALAARRVSEAELTRVHAELDRQLGPFAGFFVCPHDADAGCGCRKPAPGLLASALARLDVAPGECALVGDIGSDVEAARALGIRAVLVPTPATRREEIARAPLVAPDLDAAVRLLLGGAR
jgi:histidinol-phosphate phosphatase family protein